MNKPNINFNEIAIDIMHMTESKIISKQDIMNFLESQLELMYYKGVNHALADANNKLTEVVKQL